MNPENIAGYVDEETGDFIITRDCPKCKRRQELRAKVEDFVDWRSGRKLLQQAFPYLTAAQRELLSTGICNQCWETMFGEEATNEYAR